MMDKSKQENQSVCNEQNTKRRGRPKSFNEQVALEQAMLLFWQHGYEGTSISDLTQALGITAPSLYATFGDKAALFDRCIVHYVQQEALPAEQILQNAKTAKQAVELYLYESIRHLVQKDKPKGCMLVVATMNCSQQNTFLQEHLKQIRLQSRNKLLERLNLGFEQGEIANLDKVMQLCDFYTTLLYGMTIQAIDGASADHLHSIVKNAMNMWDQIIFQSCLN